MFREARRMVRNPTRLLAYAIRNPKKVAAALLILIVLAVLVVVSFQLGLLPNWIVAVALVPILGWLAHRRWERVRLLVSVSEVDSGAVTSGAVKVTGNATAAVDGDRVTSEMTDRECLAYRYKRRVDRNPNDNASIEDIGGGHTEERSVPFYVEDGTGEVLVDSNNADIELAWDEKSRGAREDTFEAYLQEGDHVNVYGTAMPPSERGAPGMMDAVSDTYDRMAGRNFEEYADGEDLVVTKGPDEPHLIVSDRPGWRLLARHVIIFLAVAALAVAALAVGLLQALGVLSI